MDKQDPKYDLVFDLIEHPENYTSEQFAKILSDPETREFYRLLCLTDSAIEAYKMNIDVDAEWNDFTRKYHIIPPRRFMLFGNRAASIAAIICTSILAVGAGIAVTVSVINRGAEPLGDTNPAEIITTAHTKPSDISATPTDTLTAVSMSKGRSRKKRRSHTRAVKDGKRRSQRRAVPFRGADASALHEGPHSVLS